VKPFPRNCLSLMTVSGAKGGPVNFAQISALLGQQELEGRRVPRLPSGKTLPCFSAWDTAARAGGFIGDRFLTGIRPQEYYFHCMAGREGLVDTAVKTSRSGYLQRCLVKNLEALRIGYDGTVRDCDGGVVQFTYGEDGLDVTKTAYSRQFSFLAANAAAVATAFQPWAAQRAAPPLQRDAAAGFGPPGLPPMARFPAACTVGAVGEAYRDALEAYVAANPEGHLLSDARAHPRRRGSSAADGGASGADAKGRVRASEFIRLMELRHMAASASPGEAVGVIAAQSVGEPSTQMTLNTFHFAGRGEANVTLGIPRLRELLMAAARRIGTPVMTLPTPGGEAAAAAVAARLRRVSLAELLTAFTVTEEPFAEGACRRYTIAARVRHAGAGADMPRDGVVGFEEIADAFRSEFTRQLMLIIKIELRRASAADAAAIQSMRAAAAVRAGAGGGEGEEGGGGGDDEEGGGGAAARRARGAEAAAEVGEAAGDGGDAEDAEDDEEGAKADERRGARDGEGYTLPDGDDDAAAVGRRGAPPPAADGDEDEGDAAAAVPAAAADDEDDSGDAEEDDDDDDDDEGAGGAAAGGGGGGGARRSRGARGSSLLTDLDELTDSVSADAEASELRATLRLGIGAPKLLMLALAQRAAALTAVRVTKGIKACYVVQDDKDGSWKVQTDGINFAAAHTQGAAVDACRIGSNDVFAVLTQYGVEAARATLLAEVRAVFGAYGIAVDARHLSLIADAMTHGGAYRPCSRAGLDSCPSPLLKMSFETATAFLTDATLRGATDTLESPSSRLVLGRVVALGTGACGLQFDLPRAAALHAARMAAAV
jgi:DNA-directed RNA polymerase I subunit RPA1